MSENNRLQGMGKAKFVLVRGVIYYGIPIGLIAVFLSAIRREGFSATLQPITLVSCSITGVIYGSFIGIVYGLIMWKYHNQKRDSAS